MEILNNHSTHSNESFRCHLCCMTFPKQNMLKMHQIIHDVDDEFSFKYGPSADVEGLEGNFLSRRVISSKTKSSLTEPTKSNQTLSDKINVMKNDYIPTRPLSPDDRRVSFVDMTTVQTRAVTADSNCCKGKDIVNSSKKLVLSNTAKQSEGLITKNNDGHYRKRWLVGNKPENTECYVYKGLQTNRIISNRNQREDLSVPNIYMQHGICNQDVRLADNRNVYKRPMNHDILERENHPNEKRMKLNGLGLQCTNEDFLSFRPYIKFQNECNNDNRLCTQTYIEDDIERERDFLVEEKHEPNIQNSLSPGLNSEDRTHDGMYKCTYCGVMMKQDELRKHIFIAHESIFETKTKSVPSSNILYCSKSQSSTNRNVREDQRKCSESNTRSEMNVNSQMHKSNSQCHKCGFCGRVFNNVSKLRTHIANHVRNEIHGQKQQKVLNGEELGLILKYL